MDQPVVQTGQPRLHNVKEQKSEVGHRKSERFPSRHLASIRNSVDFKLSEVPTSDGGADRDRTDDLKLAKLALSQLSYGPFRNQGSGIRDQII